MQRPLAFFALAVLSIVGWTVLRRASPLPVAAPSEATAEEDFETASPKLAASDAAVYADAAERESSA